MSILESFIKWEEHFKTTLAFVLTDYLLLLILVWFIVNLSIPKNTVTNSCLLLIDREYKNSKNWVLIIMSIGWYYIYIEPLNSWADEPMCWKKIADD